MPHRPARTRRSLRPILGYRVTASPGSSRRDVRRVVVAGMLLLSALAGCAAAPKDPARRAALMTDNDPLEPLNRKTLAVNQVLDRLLFKPLAEAYVTVLPGGLRDAVHRMLDNMREPTNILNDALQGEVELAGTSFERFGINTTVGLAGAFDVASKWGLKRAPGDFGQTLYVWGVPSGPYLVLPVLGPSNPRDGFGMVTDSYIDPLTFIANAKGLQQVEIPRLIVDGIDQRARVLDELDALEKSSLDFYAQLRSLWQQKRAAELNRGAIETPKNFYDVPASSASPAGK
jgi:phospholipid-binding lipoprotein MlaA